MNKFFFDISDKIKSKIGDRFAINVVELKKKAPFPYFFKLTASINPEKITFPTEITNLIISVDKIIDPNDSLIIGVDLNRPFAELYDGEGIELPDIGEITFVFYKSNLNFVEFRLWCW